VPWAASVRVTGVVVGRSTRSLDITEMAVSQRREFLIAISLSVLAASCRPSISKEDVQAAEALALRFAQEVSTRNYARAYAMTTAKYRSEVSLAAFQKKAEWMLPLDFGTILAVELVETHDMREALTYEEGDLRWAYVAIQGPKYGEAVAVIVARYAGSIGIREVEWGRP
jgi:hypothetical protein